MRRREDSMLSRVFGTALVGVFLAGGFLASVLLLVAIVAGLWRFISWAVGA